MVVYYAAEFVYDYAAGTRSGSGLRRKFTHTRMKSDGRWQIIGGTEPTPLAEAKAVCGQTTLRRRGSDSTR